MIKSYVESLLGFPMAGPLGTAVCGFVLLILLVLVYELLYQIMKWVGMK